MPPHRTVLSKFASLFLASTLLAACASSPRPTGRGDLRLDTETAGRVRHVAAAGKAASTLAPSATRTATSNLGQLAPFLLSLQEALGGEALIISPRAGIVP